MGTPHIQEQMSLSKARQLKQSQREDGRQPKNNSLSPPVRIKDQKLKTAVFLRENGPV